MFQDITPLQTQESGIPKIRSFSPMTESQVKKDNNGDAKQNRVN